MVYEIELQSENWQLEAGLIGLKRLYQDDIRHSRTGLYISSEILDTLAEKYFQFFLQTYSVAERDYKRMKRLLAQAHKKPETAKDRQLDIRKIASDQLKKVVKYFSETEECKNMEEIIERMKECKKQEHLVEMEQHIENYYKVMRTKFIEEKLTINYAKAVIISPFFGQPSFLQASCNNLNLEQHIEKMNRDFIANAQLEINFHELLYSHDDTAQLKKFLEQNNHYSVFKNWFKEIKKLENMEEIRSYFKENVLPCTFNDQLLSTMSYEEMMFSPLGISKENASNFYWDFNKISPIPMSAITRLILFLIPVGVAFYQRKLGSDTSSEYKQFAGMVIQDSTFIENYKANETYRNMRQAGSSYSDIIIGLLSDVQERSKRKVNSYLFVEIHSEYSTKKTLLDYYHMPTYVATYFSQYGNSQKLLFINELRDQFIRSVLGGIDPKQAVFEYLRNAIKDNRNGYSAFIATRERQRLLLLKKGGKDVDIKKHDDLVEKVYEQGEKLKKKIISKNFGQDSDIYRAPSTKKIDSIAYKLLNQVKGGNKQDFFESVLRLHIASGERISPILLDINKEEGLDFETIGSSFVAGLISTEETSKKEEKTNG